MTPQEVFDKVVAHLRAQGCKAENKDTCLYRGPGGTKCAAGCLIDDEDYRSSFEGSTFDRALRRVPSLQVKLGEHESLIMALQRVHDRFEVYDWECSFAHTAGLFGLVYTPPAPASGDQS